MAWVVAGSERPTSTAGTGRITYTVGVRFWTSLADITNSRLLQILGTVPTVNRTRNKPRITLPIMTIVRVLALRAGRSGADFGASGVPLLIQLPGGPSAQQAVGHWDEEQRVEGSNHQSADHGSAQWSVLFTSCAQPEAHREHAQQHRHRCHEHRSKPRPACG